MARSMQHRPTPSPIASLCPPSWPPATPRSDPSVAPEAHVLLCLLPPLTLTPVAFRSSSPSTDDDTACPPLLRPSLSPSGSAVEQGHCWWRREEVLWWCRRKRRWGRKGRRARKYRPDADPAVEHNANLGVRSNGILRTRGHTHQRWR
ncbi:hypothetical protein E2562_030512 [Oryza meyeriana var. granulata]|uniref:Uncharacterized protein n=1 Tax=Oryza meyeriana var. granulata TaxID=110450 RepID=A0A6G1BP46_9ORYZ|nr:hypothetical protein E2562_030512 [Oryza meyeriana var. granulata]